MMTNDDPRDLAPSETESIRYRREKFSTRLYRDCLYTPAHAWLRSEGNGIWRVGLTRFAARMLGDPVELDFEVQDGEPVERGQEVGWIEGFKAVSDLYTPLSGIFRGGNGALIDDIELLGKDPHREGWLFRVEGVPGEDCIDVDAYMVQLDKAIDKILGNNSPS
jgi:glycine cleavage system H protein